MLAHAFGRYDGALEEGDLFRHHHIQVSVGPKVNLEGEVFLGFRVEIQVVLSAGEGDPVPALGVGAHIGGGVLVKDHHTGQGKAALGLEHGAVHGGAAAVGILFLTDGVNLVPVGGREGVAGVGYRGGVHAIFLKIAVRQAQAHGFEGGAEQRTGSGFVVRMPLVPFVGKHALFSLGNFPEAASVGPLAKFLERSIGLERIGGCAPAEVVHQIRVVIAVHVICAAEVGVRAENLAVKGKERLLAVHYQLEEAFRGFGEAHVAKVNEAALSQGEPGHLVPVQHYAGGVLVRTGNQLHGVCVHIQEYVLVQLAVVQDISRGEGPGVHVIGAVVAEGVSVLHPSPVQGGKLLGLLLVAFFLSGGREGCKQ